MSVVAAACDVKRHIDKFFSTLQCFSFETEIYSDNIAELYDGLCWAQQQHYWRAWVDEDAECLTIQIRFNH